MTSPLQSRLADIEDAAKKTDSIYGARILQVVDDLRQELADEAKRNAPVAALKLGVEMRRLQTEFYRAKHGSHERMKVLGQARAAESAFDKAAAAILNPPPQGKLI